MPTRAKSPTTETPLDIVSMTLTPTCGAASQRKRSATGRVSSARQGEDLQRQVDFMRERYPDAGIVTDVGGGLNFAGKDLYPYWSDSIAAIKLRMWLPTVTGWHRCGF